MGRYMRLWVYAICCRYQTGLHTSCGVWNTGASTTITTTLSSHYRWRTAGECWTKVKYLGHKNVQQSCDISIKAICEYNIQVIVSTRKLFRDAPSLRMRLSKAVLNVEEDILVSKVCQKFPIGDFYFYIATVLHRPRKEHNWRNWNNWKWLFWNIM